MIITSGLRNRTQVSGFLKVPRFLLGTRPGSCPCDHSDTAPHTLLLIIEGTPRANHKDADHRLLITAHKRKLLRPGEHGEVARLYLRVGKQQSCNFVLHHCRVPRDVPCQHRDFQIHRLKGRKEQRRGGRSRKSFCGQTSQSVGE